MKSMLLGLGILFFCVSCQPTQPTSTIQQPSETPDTTAVNSTEIPGDGIFCYEFKDSFTVSTIQLVVTGMKVTGTLHVDQHSTEMSNSADGIIKGVRQGDLINVIFDYTIEGSHQIEDQEYNFSGMDQLIQKVTTLEEKGGKLVMTQEVVGSKTFHKVACQQ